MKPQVRDFLIGVWEFSQIIVMTIGFVATVFAVMGIIGLVHVMFFNG